MDRFHFILDLTKVNVKYLIDSKFIEGLIKEICTLIDMKILLGPISVRGVDSNPGWTVFTIIDFSHISIHTFALSNEIWIDICSCKKFDFNLVMKLLTKKFKINPSQIKTREYSSAHDEN